MIFAAKFDNFYASFKIFLTISIQLVETRTLSSSTIMNVLNSQQASIQSLKWFDST